MGIYIKGMEMPKCCAKCSFETLFSDDIHYCTVGEIAEEIPTENYWGCRPSFCQMSEVPKPHGRLIDADALNRIYEEKRHEHPWQHDGDDWYVGVIDANDELINAPTVIEREVEE